VGVGPQFVNNIKVLTLARRGGLATMPVGHLPSRRLLRPAPISVVGCEKAQPALAPPARRER